nr:PREDICTED: uncharacterized protein LOC108953452 isoform X2 [Musa acuminata subsp. malaccensis]
MRYACQLKLFLRGGKLRLVSWSARMGSTEELPEQPASSPCWKKKAPDAGFLANVKDHLDQFVGTSMDQHRICLKKTIRGVGDFVKLRKQGKFDGPVLGFFFLLLLLLVEGCHREQFCC